MELNSDVISSGIPNLTSALDAFPDSFTPTQSPNKQFSLSPNVSPNQSRRFFDQRLRTNFNTTQLIPTGLVSSVIEKESSLDSPNLTWGRLRKIGDIIFSIENQRLNGSPTVMVTSDSSIAFGTDKSVIYIFSLQQELTHIVKTSNLKLMLTITCIAFSYDSTYIVVGYSNGYINLWDLTKTDPIITVKPVTLHELHHNGSHFTVGHIEGAAIRNLEFVGARHTSFLSSDHRGMLFFHNGGRSILGFYCNSKILIGKYDFGVIDYTKAILGFNGLPLGRLEHESDLLGLVGFITPQALVVVSTKPKFKTQYKIGRSSLVDSKLDLTGCLFWFPVSQIDNKFRAPSLVFAWSNVLIILDVSTSKHKDEYDEVEVTLDFINKRRWTCLDSITVIRQFNSDVIFVMTKTQRAYFVSRKDLTTLKEFDLVHRNLKYIDIFVDNDIGLDTQSYSQSLNCFKSNIFIFDKREVSIGSLSNWADILMVLINSEKYIEALSVSRDQYLGKTDLLLIGLPEDDTIRHGLVRRYLVQIFKTSMKSMFQKPKDTVISDDDIDQKEKYSTLLHFCLETCIVIEADSELYDLLFDVLSSNGYENLFFQELEEFILTSKISVLSPTILKAMVEYYFTSGNPAVLESMICLLDITQLDIDFTLTICKKYNLNDTLSYIWSTILGDYFTPIVDALKQIKSFNEDSTLTTQQKFEIYQNVSYVYPFIAYTLTGRQYPTDKPINHDKFTAAKLNIYYFLFSGSAISWPPNTPKFHVVNDYHYEPAFPYLHALLRFDSKNMIASLNEAFEDEILNEDELDFNTISSNKYQLKVNRQYIIDILLSMFNDDDFKLSFIDKIYISMFISRNYPKFQQFIKLAGSITQDLIMLFCKIGKIYHSKLSLDELKEKYEITADEFAQLTPELLQDCELSLQSLLSVYKPIDIQPILIEIEDAKYYNMMFSIYKAENMYQNILDLWIKLQAEKIPCETNDDKNPFLETGTEINVKNIFQSVPNMVHNALKCTPSSQISEVVNIIAKHFNLFVINDPKGIAKIVTMDYPTLAKEVMLLKDSKSKFVFLREMFELASQGKSLNTSISGNYRLKFEYIKGLIQDLDYCRNSGGDISRSKSELTKFVLGIGKLDEDMIKLLKNSNNEIERNILVDYFVREGKYETAYEILINSIKSLSQLLESEGFTIERENEMTKSFNRCFSITESSDDLLTETSRLDSDLTLRETILLRTVEYAVQLFTAGKGKEASSENENSIYVMYKKIVSISFSYITNISKSNSQSFGNILEKYLSRPSVKITVLGDMRAVFNEVFFSSVNDEQIMVLIKKLVEADIFEDFEMIQSLKQKGWTCVNTECEICGKRIWGSLIGNEVYESWKDHQMMLVNLIEDVDKQRDEKLQVYVFQCKHAYHTKCLEGMGMPYRDKKCILCESTL